MYYIKTDKKTFNFSREAR